jgi:hypothetical protein
MRKDPQAVQGIRVFRLKAENGAIELFRFFQTSPPMRLRGEGEALPHDFRGRKNIPALLFRRPDQTAIHARLSLSIPRHQGLTETSKAGARLAQTKTPRSRERGVRSKIGEVFTGTA